MRSESRDLLEIRKMTYNILLTMQDRDIAAMKD